MNLSISLETAAIIFAALLIGAVTKGITGFGLPMVAVPLLSAMVGVERAVVVMVLPTFASNAWLLWEHRNRAWAAWRENLPLFLGAGVVGTVAGTTLLTVLSDRVLALILAAWLGLYLIMQVTHPGIEVPQRSRKGLSLGVGLTAGLAQGSMGVPGPVVATWFHALRLEPTTYVFAVCSVFFLTSAVQIFSLANLGLWTGERLTEGLLALVPSVLGVPIGIRIARYIDARKFNWFLLGVLGLTEIRLIWQGLFE
jgi:uncharacterized membrane protein YfcA